ncbi:DUF354 domain-containing protein [Helicobacter sp. MIT 21-1697]|uniref:DUF354 domain-containing protein n=1 Tax=Helicobacter sp. MIT 21-1697 TaxID=2993733 RepID=UPI00224A89AA|nr:DUF354 domain-containing protein [Helicobacter sp. MIT 21-1697]MCX2717687.1 DUF354 domain-containing protein [Helicobacter sp. MIT 21-1697]
MIWLDIIDPKYVLFFKSLLSQLKALDSVIVTTRKSANYDECARLLELFNIQSYAIGGYGGASKLGKFQSRLERQIGFLELFNTLGEMPRIFITGASVDGVQCAFGLGIPVVHFADTPVAGERFCLKDLTILSRLTLPLSALVFRPFVVPEICYTSLGLQPSQVKAYNFIDVALWLQDVPLSFSRDCKERAAFCTHLGLDENLPIILVREEEYKAHYVKQKLPIIYQSVMLLAQSGKVNVLLMPRYGEQELESLFGKDKYVKILKQKLEPKAFYPFIDMLLGGGGTMNLEACYLGIPVISTRSLLLFHDRFLLKHKLMYHAKSVEEVMRCVDEILSSRTPPCKRDDLFAPNGADFSTILPHIKSLMCHS